MLKLKGVFIKHSDLSTLISILTRSSVLSKIRDAVLNDVEFKADQIAPLLEFVYANMPYVIVNEEQLSTHNLKGIASEKLKEGFFFVERSDLNNTLLGLAALTPRLTACFKDKKEAYSYVVDARTRFDMLIAISSLIEFGIESGLSDAEITDHLNTVF